MPTYNYEYFVKASYSDLETLEENANQQIADDATAHREYRDALITWASGIGSNPPTPPPRPPGV